MSLRNGDATQHICLQTGKNHTYDDRSCVAGGFLTAFADHMEILARLKASNEAKKVDREESIGTQTLLDHLSAGMFPLLVVPSSQKMQ